MNQVVKGGCACGAVRYSASAEVEISFNCYCRNCQRATGGGHSSAFALPVSGLTITGSIKEFRQGSDEGAATFSGFCGTCGSPLTRRTERFPERLYFFAATRDDPSAFQPSFNVFEECAQPWDLPKTSAKTADH